VAGPGLVSDRQAMMRGGAGGRQSLEPALSQPTHAFATACSWTRSATAGERRSHMGQPHQTMNVGTITCELSTRVRCGRADRLVLIR